MLRDRHRRYPYCRDQFFLPMAITQTPVPPPPPRPASTNKWTRFLKNWMHWDGNHTVISESLICQRTLPQMRGAAMKKHKDTSTPSQKPSFTASNKHAPPMLQHRRGTATPQATKSRALLYPFYQPGPRKSRRAKKNVRIKAQERSNLD